MSCELKIERSDGYRLSLTFDGPPEVAAALAQVIADFESPKAPPSEPSRPVAPPESTPRLRSAPLTNAEKCRRRRERLHQKALGQVSAGVARHQNDTATRCRDTENDTAPVSESVAPVSPPVSGVALAPASRSGSLPSLSPAFSGSHEEKEKEEIGDRARATPTPTPRPGVATPTPPPVPRPLPAARADDGPVKVGKRPRPITPDWEPAPGQVAALCQKLFLRPRDVEERLDGFRDYWLGCAKPKADWNATFRTWIRREVEEGKFERVVPQPALEPEELDTRTPEQIQAGKDWWLANCDAIAKGELGPPLPGGRGTPAQDLQTSFLDTSTAQQSASARRS